MTKYQFNLLMKQISAIKAALAVVNDEAERRKLFRRMDGLKLLRDSEQYGVIA